MSRVEIVQHVLPSNWAWSQIGALLSIRNGSAFKSKDYVDHGVPLIRQTNLKSKSVDVEAAVCLPEHYIEDNAEFLIRRGDYLVGMSGSLGKISCYREDMPALQNQRTGLLTLREKSVSGYLFRYFEFLEHQIALAGKGVGVQNISSKELEMIPIPVPPQAEAQRISAKTDELLSHLDAGMEGLKKAKALLKRYRQSVLKAAMEGKLTTEWREKNKDKIEPASELLKRILVERREKWETEQLAKMKAKGKLPKNDDWKKKYKEPNRPDTTDLRELPGGWVWATVEQVADSVVYGSSKKTSVTAGGVPVLRMGNIVDGELNWEKLKYLPKDHDEFPALLLSKGDLLFNRTNSAELVGKSAVYESSPGFASFASYLIRCRFGNGVDSYFVSSCINSVLGRKWIKSVVSQQVGQANVNGTKLKSFAFPMPSVQEQAEVSNRLRQIRAAESNLLSVFDTERKRAEALRRSILSHAFTGKLVPQDPDDEPASKLLERIKSQ
ncbi:MAG: restriction endonuclease subunit S [candidate division Zixibacteria bacterium]|nr:restriction endonuclease subunit S [candidate division Zixibacteria bacterium]